ncbi:hypothetical protein DICVIV_13700 [Dictyocaulus viviparus]|uniref:Tumor protein p53-inducible protein 11 n=1 Tax=Dictyocaulus viviparus TaxID=29172 RepID=A0A0D8X9P8_DICVI|nr:hypothetical protein DICVIV_13700 [Dictyocaulus viviparus]
MIDEKHMITRKQSASDLQSRLKTRKLLGVGELARDNGDIYKSKGLIAPHLALRLDYGLEIKSDDSVFITRMYGACLICYGILFRTIISQRENRSEIATLLLVTALLQTLQLSVALVFGQRHEFPCFIRAVGIVGNLIYNNFVDSQGGVYRHLQHVIEDCSVLSTSCRSNDLSTEKSASTIKPIKSE